MGNKGTQRSAGGLMTTDEVFAYLKITPRTIYRLIRAGDIPAFRVGRQWRFRRTDLDGWLDSQRGAAEPVGRPS